MSKWDSRFLDMAQLVASWSKDPSTKTGAVIVRPDYSVAAVGFNGFPKNMLDNPARYENREEKYSRIIHCEINAMLHCREQLTGYTLYTVPFLSCDRCCVQMLQAGIVRLVAPACPSELKERWEPAFERVRQYCKEAGVVVTEI